MTQKTDCSHGHGGPAPGPVYQASVYLPNGIILTSSPLTHEAGSALMKSLHDSLPRGSGTSIHFIGPSHARTGLEEAAATWRENAVTIETHLAPGHAHFEDSAADCIEHADRFEAEARALMD